MLTTQFSLNSKNMNHLSINKVRFYCKDKHNILHCFDVTVSLPNREFDHLDLTQIILEGIKVNLQPNIIVSGSNFICEPDTKNKGEIIPFPN